MKDGKIQQTFNKEDVLNHIEEIEQNGVKIPEIISCVQELKKQNIPIQLKEWTMQELTQEIVKELKK